MLGEALAYATRGWPVFPCHPNDKRPLTPGPIIGGNGAPIEGTGGLYYATTDEAQIREWWKRDPQAMIGLPTGKKIGAFVIDLDPKDSDTADALLSRIAQAVGGTLPPCPMVRTPRGGLHLYLAMPEGQAIGNRANCAKDVVGAGVDVRGDGGYVIAPPSVRKGLKAQADGCDGVAYAWEIDSGLDDFEPPVPSAELIRFVTDRDFGRTDEPPPSRAGSELPPDDKRRADAIRKFAIAAFDAEARSVATCGHGGRNDQLNRSAFALGQLVGAGVLNEATCAAALEEAAAACGLAKDDGVRSVRATIRSGLRGGMASPRDLSDVGARAGSAGRRDRPPMPADDGPAAPRGEDGRGSRGAGRASSGGDGGRGSAPSRGAGDDGDEPDWDLIERLAAEPQNDTGNARRIIGHFGADMMVVRDVGPHHWTGTHWEPQGAGEAFLRFAQQTAEKIALEAETFQFTRADRDIVEMAKALDGKARDELTEADRELLIAAKDLRARLAKRKSDRRKFALSCGNSARISAMITQSAPHITVPPDALDTDALAINVLNGTLRFWKEKVQRVVDDIGDTFEDAPAFAWRVRLDEHRREDRIAKLIPVEYDPRAKAPKWTAFMERFQPTVAIREFLQRFHGYALTGMTGEQMFVFNYGLGANGKSTFMEAIGRLMGDYAKVLPAEALTGDAQISGGQATPHFARLPGARLVRAAELPRGQTFRESTLKMLTGGEAMLVRHLNEGFFEFVPSFKAIGSGNDKPPIGGVDEGIWRRMKLVPWGVTIPAAERRPLEKVLAEFMEEAPGILNWLIAGAIAYLTGGINEPEEIRAATDAYRDEMDPVGEFTSACVEKAPGEDVTARDMFLAYTAWCHANSVKPFAEKGFASIMIQKGFEKDKGRIRKYKNVRLGDVPADPELKDKYSGDDWTRG